MAKSCPLLISYWIKGTDPRGPYGFGVTAWSLEDAVALIRAEGYSIEEETAEARANVFPHDVDWFHTPVNAGPAVFRGVWYPCLNIGWGASGQH
jgi:hypothetical protein